MVNTVLLIAAWIEIIVGASFVLALNAQTQLLFGTTIEGPGAAFARLAGIALIALGVACLPSRLEGTRQHPVRVLLFYNIGAAILFAWIGATTTLWGVVLWPVVILHGVLAVALALSLVRGSRVTVVPTYD
jgi:hypothetical protein